MGIDPSALDKIGNIEMGKCIFKAIAKPRYHKPTKRFPIISTIKKVEVRKLFFLLCFEGVPNIVGTRESILSDAGPNAPKNNINIVCTKLVVHALQRRSLAFQLKTMAKIMDNIKVTISLDAKF